MKREPQGRSRHARLPATPTLLVLVLAAHLSAAPAGSLAKVYCSEPVRPFCADREGVFEDASAEARCRSDVEKFHDEMQAYVECLGRQQQDARERADEIKTRFECLSRGARDCP